MNKVLFLWDDRRENVLPAHLAECFGYTLIWRGSENYFEGASVKLVSQFEEEKNPLYKKAKDAGLIAGVCMACSKVLGVYDQNKDSGLALLDDMSGHAGMKKIHR